MRAGRWGTGGRTGLWTRQARVERLGRTAGFLPSVRRVSGLIDATTRSTGRNDLAYVDECREAQAQDPRVEPQSEQRGQRGANIRR